MKKEDLLPTVVADSTPSSMANYLNMQWQRVIRRRSFLRGLGMASAALSAGAFLPPQVVAQSSSATGKLPKGDVAILRFLAAAEIIESDLWSQYAELGGAAPDRSEEFQGFNKGNAPYLAALQNLDADMPQYITDNTDDELSHAAFLNGYLIANGEKPVSLKKFERLTGSSATGASGKLRITNLMNLTVDTSFYTRYRSSENPDFGDTFAQAVTIAHQPAIPLDDKDTPPNTVVPSPPIPHNNRDAERIQAIANTAAFHFAFIEQGGSSLYPTMALKVTNLEVLRIVLSIGGVEIDHFSLWHDKLGNAVSQPLAGVTDPRTGLTFPDLNSQSQPAKLELSQTNKILAEPCEFIREGLPNCSVIRPVSAKNSGAVAAVKAFHDDNLFQGQGNDFLDKVMKLAVAADAAQREF